MRALYLHPTESQLEEVVQEVESGHGGKVDFPEFIEILVGDLFSCGYIIKLEYFVDRNMLIEFKHSAHIA